MFDTIKSCFTVSNLVKGFITTLVIFAIVDVAQLGWFFNPVSYWRSKLSNKA